LQKGITVLNY